MARVRDNELTGRRLIVAGVVLLGWFLFALVLGAAAGDGDSVSGWIVLPAVICGGGLVVAGLVVRNGWPERR